MLSNIEELVEEFSDLDEREACELLDELGRQIPKIPESVYVEENLVPGCQSRVWVENHLNDDRTVAILADSDAFVVKGLIYVVLEMFGNKRPKQILDIDYVSIFDRMGVGQLILPQRKNGLFSLVRRIRSYCGQVSGESQIETLAASPTIPLAEPSQDIGDIASSFPILCQTLPNGKRPIFLDSGASAQKPRAVIDKMVEVQTQYYANAFRGKYYFGQRVDDEIETTRSKVAGLLGAQRADEIVFTPGTTQSINLVAQAWGRKNITEGDEIVITEMEHHANFVPWQAIAKSQRAQLKIIPITPAGLLDMDALRTAVSQRTKMVAVCSMSNVLGTNNPVEEIVRIAHNKNALVLIDAAQSAPHRKIDVQQLNIDFLTFSGHKLYGPSGIGVLYGKRAHLTNMDPFLYGGHMIETVGVDGSTWAEPPAKFEAGTPPITPIIGLGAAIDFVGSIGFDAIQELEHSLLLEAHEQLSQIDGLKIFGPVPMEKGAIVSFTIEGISTEDLAMRLDDAGVFTRHGHHCAMVLHKRLGIAATTRASFGLYNTKQDVKVFAESVRSAAQQLRK